MSYSSSMQAFIAKPPPLVAAADGAIRVAGSRVSLETLVGAFDAGATAEEIVQQYPSLSLGSAYGAIAYVLENRATVDAYVAERQRNASALQADVEAKAPPEGLRARLLARQSSSSDR
jgi:uncharacterized protein (DUF433 family)